MKGPDRRWVAAAVCMLSLAVAGCAEPSSFSCGDRICRGGLMCDAERDRCISPRQLEACVGRDEMAGCDVDGNDGRCESRACMVFVCGDGKREGLEQCDGDDRSTCQTLGFYRGGDVRCGVDCRFDTGACSEWCGDGARNGSERCDGPDLGGATCRALGFYEEAGLTCNQICSFDIAGCRGFCGDHLINGGEVCDGGPPAQDCVDLGYDFGVPGCTGFCGASTDSCGHIGWTHHELFEDAGALWSDGRFLFVANLDTRVFDGSKWRVLARGTEHAYAAAWAVWGTRHDDVWFANGRGEIVHWDGNALTPVVGTGVFGQFRGIWGLDRNRVYGAHSDGLAYFDGASWSKVELPAEHGTLTDVWGSAEDDIYAVGRGTLLHQDGRGWSTLAYTPGVEEGNPRVWGSGRDDVYIVEGDQVRHHDGASWSKVDLPADERFVDVGGSARNDVYVLTTTRVYRYDGQRWTRVAEHVSDDSKAIWIEAPGQVWVAGRRGVERLSGAWQVSVQPRDLPPVTRVWASDARHYVVGYEADGYTYVDRVVDDVWYRGTVVPGRLRRLRGFAVDDVYAVGSFGVLHFDGDQWTQEFDLEVADLWRTDDGVFACSYAEVLHREGAHWTRTPTPLQLACTSGWGSSKDDIYLTTFYWTYHWDGVSWQRLEPWMKSVWGTAPDDVFGVGEGKVFHFDGQRWSVVAQLYARQLEALIVPIERDDIFVIASDGEAVHFDGERWSRTRRLATAVQDASATPSRVFMAGPDGLDALVRPTRWTCLARERRDDDGIDDDCDGRIDEEDP